MCYARRRDEHAARKVRWDTQRKVNKPMPIAIGDWVIAMERNFLLAGRLTSTNASTASVREQQLHTLSSQIKAS